MSISIYRYVHYCIDYDSCTVSDIDIDRCQYCIDTCRPDIDSDRIREFYSVIDSIENTYTSIDSEPNSRISICFADPLALSISIIPYQGGKARGYFLPAVMTVQYYE